MARHRVYDGVVRIALLLIVVAAGLAACKPYRIEYAQRPAFYQSASTTRLPDEITLDDGTVVRYSTYGEQSSYGRKGEEARKPLQIREEMPDGKIVLRAMLPEHVLANTVKCLADEEYDLLWDQMLSEQTRQRFEAEAGGKDACIAYWKKHRHDMVATLTRMLAGMHSQEVRFDAIAPGVTRCRLRPQFVGELKFKYFDVVKEGLGLKLLNHGG